MIEHLRTHNYRVEQGIALAAMAAVFFVFGGVVIWHQIRRHIPVRWPLPGGYVGGVFLLATGMLPFVMMLLRFRITSWNAYGWQQTAAYVGITVIAVATLVRYLRFGFKDHVDGWDGITERRRTFDRRRHWGRVVDVLPDGDV